MAVARLFFFRFRPVTYIARSVATTAKTAPLVTLAATVCQKGMPESMQPPLIRNMDSRQPAEAQGRCHRFTTCWACPRPPGRWPISATHSCKLLRCHVQADRPLARGHPISTQPTMPTSWASEMTLIVLSPMVTLSMPVYGPLGSWVGSNCTVKVQLSATLFPSPTVRPERLPPSVDREPGWEVHIPQEDVATAREVLGRPRGRRGVCRPLR